MGDSSSQGIQLFYFVDLFWLDLAVLKVVFAATLFCFYYAKHGTYSKSAGLWLGIDGNYNAKREAL